ncbi:MAG TPA: hypothetical protein VLA64_12810 [Azonexus sp.]|nr:hypothetical protein [Azonexus sp.]
MPNPSRILHANAKDYVTKSNSLEVLLRTISEAPAGRRILSPNTEMTKLTFS